MRVPGGASVFPPGACPGLPAPLGMEAVDLSRQAAALLLVAPLLLAQSAVLARGLVGLLAGELVQAGQALRVEFPASDGLPQAMAKASIRCPGGETRGDLNVGNLAPIASPSCYAITRADESRTV